MPIYFTAAVCIVDKMGKEPLKTFLPMHGKEFAVHGFRWRSLEMADREFTLPCS